MVRPFSEPPQKRTTPPECRHWSDRHSRAVANRDDLAAAIDLAVVDARPADSTATDSLLAVEARDGTTVLRLSDALARLPAWALIARRYRRSE